MATQKKLADDVNPAKELENVGITRDADVIIFVGSGVVWGGKEGGIKSALAQFDEYRLLKTSDPKVIKYMRDNNYPEVTYEMLESFINAGTYFESLSGLIKKKLPKNQTPGVFSDDQIQEILK